jgi:hypothetical protein
MDNSNVERLTKDIMTDSRLNLADPIFDEKVMNKILLENKRLKSKNLLLLNILVFTGIEFIVFALFWILLLYFPGIDYFKNAINSSLAVLEKIGNIVIEYGYLVVSIVLVYFLDIIFSRKAKVTLPT